MSDSLPNVILPRGVWVNLYTATTPPIAVGTQIIVQNLTTSHVRLVTKATQPTNVDGFNTLPPFKESANEAGDSGAWALSISGGAINVREA